jgi:hypothetical protein
MEKERVVDLRGCARCHGDGHKQLVFRPLTHPVEMGDGTMTHWAMTHWAPCPTNGEPILMGYVEHPDAE